MPTSRFDAVYRSVLLSRFFVNGWGRPEDLRRIIELRRGRLPKVNHNDYPIRILKEDSSQADYRILEGSFTSPFLDLAPELLPPSVRNCHFQAILPKSHEVKPLVVQYAGTGDHYFWRRRQLMALPLLRERGIASLLIENPFYGLRKPPEQRRSTLRNVTDLLVMGACLIMESSVIYSLAGKSWGHWPIVSHGISMGGHMAALSALNWDEENAPIGLVPCMAACSASWTFTSGVLSDSLPWDLLEEQYYNEVRYHNDIRKLIYPNEEALKKVISQYPPYIPESKWSQILRLSHPKSQKKSDSVVEFMRGVLDECTHFRNYCSPMDPSLIILVASDIDAYQPKDGAQVFQDIWPGVEIRYIKEYGHVQSYLFRQKDFRRAIYDVIDRMKEKYG